MSVLVKAVPVQYFLYYFGRLFFLFFFFILSDSPLPIKLKQPLTGVILIELFGFFFYFFSFFKIVQQSNDL